MTKNKIIFLITILFSFFCLGAVFKYKNRVRRHRSCFKQNKISETENVVDMVVIGSGPAGLSAATHGSRAGVKTLVLEGINPGGQLMETTWIENFPAVSKILGSELIKNLRQQAKNFGAMFIEDSVKKIDFTSLPYAVYTEKGNMYHARTIIISTGVSSSNLNVRGESEYYGKGVTHSAISEGPLYRGKDIVIVGGGDSAIEYATQLSVYVANITLLVRGSEMRAVESSKKKLKKLPNVSVILNTSIEEVLGDGTHVTGVRWANNVTGETGNLETNAVFLAIGNEPNTQFLEGAIELDKDGYILLKGVGQGTSIPGVFAAGDVTAGKVPLAGVAAGCGIQAGFEAVRFLIDSVDASESKNVDYTVCFCKGVSYSTIVKAIQEGYTTLDALRQKLGVCSGCRTCAKEIELILKKIKK